MSEVLLLIQVHSKLEYAQINGMDGVQLMQLGQLHLPTPQLFPHRLAHTVCVGMTIDAKRLRICSKTAQSAI